jgi:hypothetical protein
MQKIFRWCSADPIGWRKSAYGEAARLPGSNALCVPWRQLQPLPQSSLRQDNTKWLHYLYSGAYAAVDDYPASHESENEPFWPWIIPDVTMVTASSTARRFRKLSSCSQDLTYGDIDDKGWKYTGYRQFSRFTASSPDFFLVRRFDVLNARVALNLQDQLSELEERLEAMDILYSRKEARDVNNGTFRDELPDRAALLAEIQSKLVQYSQWFFHASKLLKSWPLQDTFISSHADLRARPDALLKNINSVRNWFENNQGAIHDDEQKYIFHTEDLISILPQQSTPLRRFLERYVIFRSSMLWLWRQPPFPHLSPHEKKLVQYANEQKLNRAVAILITVGGLGMLIAPLWVLECVGGDTGRELAVISGFIVAFLLMISVATSAKQSEALAATAAYSAVLTVFLQLGESSSGSSWTTTATILS